MRLADYAVNGQNPLRYPSAIGSTCRPTGWQSSPRSIADGYIVQQQNAGERILEARSDFLSCDVILPAVSGNGHLCFPQHQRTRDTRWQAA